MPKECIIKLTNFPQDDISNYRWIVVIMKNGTPSYYGADYNENRAKKVAQALKGFYTENPTYIGERN